MRCVIRIHQAYSVNFQVVICVPKLWYIIFPAMILLKNRFLSFELLFIYCITLSCFNCSKARSRSLQCLSIHIDRYILHIWNRDTYTIHVIKDVEMIVKGIEKALGHNKFFLCLFSFYSLYICYFSLEVEQKKNTALQINHTHKYDIPI